MVCFTKMGEHKLVVLEDTLMSDNEARERAGRHREANHASAASTVRTPPIDAKAHGGLRGILHVPKKASPDAWGDAKPDVKPQPKAVGETHPGFAGERERDPDTGGALG
jgi:hypothetical protein